jgi:hypothetical protein
LFHEDVINVPDPPAITGDGWKSRIALYIRRFHLAGITQKVVDELLNKHFSLRIPLSGESSADHWVPHVIPYNVEVAKNVWEERLAMFFDGNVEASVHRFGARVDEYYQFITSNMLGEKYLELWRKKWSCTISGQLIGDASKEPMDQSDYSVVEVKLNDDLALHTRGRKRRSVLRQRYISSGTLVSLLSIILCLAERD